MKRSCLGLLMLVCGLLGVPASASEQPEYFAVFMEGRKIGHAVHSRVVADGKITTTEKVSLSINRAGVPIQLDMLEKQIETVDGRPLGFESQQKVSMMEMKVSGTVDSNGLVHLRTELMGQEQQQTLEWPEGALMSEGLRLLQERKGLGQGTEYSVKVFVPGMAGAMDARITVGPKQKVDLLGRVVTLTEVKTAMTMPGMGEIINTSYVDDELNVQKNVTPIMGMSVEMIACSKEFALAGNEAFEMFEKMFMPGPEPIEDIGKARSVTYTLVPKTGVETLKLPSTDNQKIVRRGDKIFVTVKPVAIPASGVFPYKGSDPQAIAALKPNKFVQSDDATIIELAREAVGDCNDAGEAVRRIEKFVADYISNKSLSVGYASAVEVAQTRQGDCSEFAVLTAALCRAVGIPAQVVTGLAYVEDYGGLENTFGGHAWTRAYIGGKWVGLDAAFKSAGLGGYDAGHIALAVGDGEPEDFLALASTFGMFTIEKAEANHEK